MIEHGTYSTKSDVVSWGGGGCEVGGGGENMGLTALSLMW